MSSFVEKLDPESLKVFNEVSKRTFSEQAQFLLNAFWEELKDQADCIYLHLWEVIKKVDMDNKGISYVHLYDEGANLDFDMALRTYEATRKHFETNKLVEKYARSYPSDLTAITRKKNIKEKVDVDFDGRISFLEFLLDLYQLSPITLLERSKGGDEPEEVRLAKLALAEVQKKINEFEATRIRLENESTLPGVRGLKAKNELAQLHASPLAEELRRLLITAEAKVRICIRKYGAGSGSGPAAPNAGSVWWLETDLAMKKKKYGPQSK